MSTENYVLAARTQSRLNGILYNYVDQSFFQGKNVLEAGYGNPSAGPKLAELGCTVTVWDNSQENLDAIKSAHPELTTQLVDLSTHVMQEKYTIIYSADAIFALPDPIAAVSSMLNNCDYLFIEAMAYDNMTDTETPYIDGGNGKFVSLVAVENAAKAAGFEYKMLTKDMDSDVWYGWANDGLDTKEARYSHHFMYLCWRNGVDSPLKA